MEQNYTNNWICMFSLFLNMHPYQMKNLKKSEKEMKRIELCKHLSQGWGVLRGERIVIPLSLRSGMMNKLHEGHLGIEQCRILARDKIFWPNMNAQIADMIRKCSICLELRNSNRKEPIIPFQIPNLPWEVVATDLFTWNKTDYMVICDYYSKYFWSRKT